MYLFRFAARALRQDLRLGELRILLLALIIAVAALSAVGFFTSRVENGMSQQAAELLGADLVFAANQAFPDSLRDAARAAGLSSAQTLSFRSMVMADGRDDLLLSEIKAVGPGYPLRGQLRVTNAPNAAEIPTDALPGAGEAWIEPRLLNSLGVKVGDDLLLGESRLRIAKLLSYEPDRGGQFFNIAPRVLLSLEQLAATGLLGPGSRARHRLLLRGERDAIRAFRAAWEVEAKAQGWDVEDVEAARPTLRNALQQATRFLNLAALVAVLVAGAAVAVAAQRFARCQADAAAILRCLGATQGFVNRVYALRLLLLAGLAALLGGALGFALQAGLSALLAEMFLQTLPPPAAWPLLLGAATGLITLFGFALPALLRIAQVPPLRVLRRDLGAPPPAAWQFALAIGLAMALLIVWVAGEARLAAYMLGGLLLTLALLGGSAWVLLRALRPLRHRTGVTWRFGLANLSRRAGASSVQLAGFGIGLMALLLLGIVRVDLLTAWQVQSLDSAPNHFLINIQPDDAATVTARLAAEKVAAELYPMVPGKWLALNGARVDPDAYPPGRPQRLARRAFNLSWAEQLPGHNRLLAGHWWDGPAQCSVEAGIAETLGIQLGDTLRFRVGAREVEAEVVNLREVNWRSFQVNFFVILSPDLLTDNSATYLTSFHLPEQKSALLADLAREFPGLTAIDVAALLNQVQNIMARAALAVEYVFALTLVAGLLVLYAAIQASREERLREGALLRTLGARRGQILGALLAEFLVLGGLAGLLAAACASGLGYALARFVFELSYQFNPWLWLIGIGVGMFGVAAAGLAGTYHLLQRPPGETLRVLSG